MQIHRVKEEEKRKHRQYIVHVANLLTDLIVIIKATTSSANNRKQTTRNHQSLPKQSTQTDDVKEHETNIRTVYNYYQTPFSIVVLRSFIPDFHLDPMWSGVGTCQPTC